MIGTRYTRYAMIFSTGNDWKRQRKIISKAFDFESMRKILPIVQELAKEFFENETFTNGKEPLALQSIFLRYTWEALSRTFFGDNLNGYTVHGKPFAHGLNTFMKGQFEVLMHSQYQIFGEKAAFWNSTIRDQVKKTQEFGKVVEKMIENIT
jgi:cytochrome P450